MCFFFSFPNITNLFKFTIKVFIQFKIKFFNFFRLLSDLFPIILFFFFRKEETSFKISGINKNNSEPNYRENIIQS